MKTRKIFLIELYFSSPEDVEKLLSGIEKRYKSVGKPVFEAKETSVIANFRWDTAIKSISWKLRLCRLKKTRKRPLAVQTFFFPSKSEKRLGETVLFRNDIQYYRLNAASNEVQVNRKHREQAIKIFKERGVKFKLT